MSKYAGSPGRSIRSVKTCGCGLHGQLDDVDAERLSKEASLLELDADLLRHGLRAARNGPAQRRDPGARAAVAEPRVVQLVVPRGRAEVPHDRVVAARQEAEANVFVDGPHPDVRRRDVAD